jgi:hypothetical protein
LGFIEKEFKAEAAGPAFRGVKSLELKISRERVCCLLSLFIDLGKIVLVAALAVRSQRGRILIEKNNKIDRAD